VTSSDPLCSNCPHVVDAHEPTGCCDDCKVCEPEEAASDCPAVSAPHSESIAKTLSVIAGLVSIVVFALLGVLSMVGLVSGAWQHGSGAGRDLAYQCAQSSKAESQMPAVAEIPWGLVRQESNYDAVEKWIPPYALAKWLASPHGPVPKCPTR